MVVEVQDTGGMPGSPTAAASGDVVPAEPASMEVDDTSGKVRAAAATVRDHGAQVRARVAEVMSAIAGIDSAHAAAHAVQSAHLAKSEGDASADAQDAGKEGDADGALRAVGTTLLKTLVTLRVDIRNLHAGAADTVAMLDPFRKAAEEKRQEAENLFYRREMLKRDIVVQQSYQPQVLPELDIMSVEEMGNIHEHLRSPGDTPSEPRGRDAPGRVLNPISSSCVDSRAASEPAETSEVIDVDDSHLANGNGGLPTGSVGEMEPDGVRIVLPPLSTRKGSESHSHEGDTREEEEREHRLMMRRLESEIHERKRLAAVVTETKLTHMQRKVHNSKQKLFLSRLPKRIKDVVDAMKPLQSFFGNDDCSSAMLSVEESAVIRDLPPPLYVLAREALAARNAFGRSLAVHFLTQEAREGTSALGHPVSELVRNDRDALFTSVTDEAPAKRRKSMGSGIPVESLSGGPPYPALPKCNRVNRVERGTPTEALRSDSSIPQRDAEDSAPSARLHACSPRVVRIEILECDGSEGSHGPSNVGLPRKRPRNAAPADGSQCQSQCADAGVMMSLTFRYHPRLDVVSVSCASGTRKAPFSVEDLCMLYPYDYGRSSPNPANAHLLCGRFEFNPAFVPGGGRPYVWANLLCGLHFPGSLQLSPGSVEGMEDSTMFRDWPERAAACPTHLRFVEVIGAIRRRFASRVALQSQLQLLTRGDISSAACSAGLRRPMSRLSSFVRLPASFERKGLGLSEPSTEEFVDVWKLEIDHPNDVCISGLAAIQPNYPVGRVVFRLESQGKNGLYESEVRDIEDVVNSESHCMHDSSLAETGTLRASSIIGASMSQAQPVVDIKEGAVGVDSDAEQRRPLGAPDVNGPVRTQSPSSLRVGDMNVLPCSSEDVADVNYGRRVDSVECDIIAQMWKLLDCIDKVAASVLARIELSSMPIAHDVKIPSGPEELPRTDIEAPMGAVKKTTQVHSKSRIRDLIE